MAAPAEERNVCNDSIVVSLNARHYPGRAASGRPLSSDPAPERIVPWLRVVEHLQLVDGLSAGSQISNPCLPQRWVPSRLRKRFRFEVPLGELGNSMTLKHEMPEVQYEDTKVGRRLREQARAKIQEEVRKYGEFARGEKRQGDGV